MKIRLLFVGRTKRREVEPIVGGYLERIRRRLPIEAVVIREENDGDPPRVREVEGRRILERLQPGEFAIVLDERGKLFSSVDMASQINRRLTEGRDTVFIVGGAWGLSDAVRERADLLWSLSPLTFPHDLVRAVLAEQLYRAFTIIRGEPYHH